jgi:periplasmic protein TonB
VRGPPRIGGALAVSALAHAALLGALLLAVRPAPPPLPLAVRLLAVEAAPAPGGPVGPGAPEAAPARQLPRSRPPTKERARGRADTVHPLASAVPVDVAAEGTLVAGAGPVSPGGAGDEGAAPGMGTAGAGAGGSGGAGEASSSLLTELHRRLAEAARRCYPAAAQRFRLQGEVPVHFCLDGQGVATALSLEGSTGSPLLDRSALECVVPGAEPLPAVAGCFLVPVHFGG